MLPKLIILFVACQLFACSRESGQLKSLVSTKTIDGVIRDEIDIDPTPTLLVSDFYRSLEPAQKQVFAERLLKQFSQHVAPNLPEQMQDVLARSLFHLPVAEEASLATGLDALLSDNIHALDRLPVINVPRIGDMQSVLFSMDIIGEAPADPMFKMQDTYSIKLNGCESLPTAYAPVKDSLAVYISEVAKDQRIHDCFFANNEQLASLLNVLSENYIHTAQSRPEKVRRLSVSVTMLNGQTESRLVARFQDLSDLLHVAGYQIEVFGARSLVDFLGFAVKTESGYQPLRLASWFEMQTAAGPIVAPGEHSELGVLIHDGRGERVAQTRYYLGIPSDKLKGVPSFWRPDHFKRPKWYGYYVDFSETVATAGERNVFQDWMEATALVMSGFQSLQDTFRLPINSYGFFVCSDSLALAASTYQQRTGASQQRMTQAFPLVRAQTVYHHVAEKDVPLNKYLAQMVTISPDTLNRVYPSDFMLNPAESTKRLKAAFPKHELWRLKDFPGFQETMQGLHAD